MKKPAYIKIVANLRDFGLEKDTVHKVVPCPKEYAELYEDDVWVYSAERKEPVRLMGREYNETTKPKKDTTLTAKLQKKLSELEIEDTIIIDDYLKEVHGGNDYFIRRSFDVLLASARRNLKPKTFKVNRGILTRIT